MVLTTELVWTELSAFYPSNSRVSGGTCGPRQPAQTVRTAAVHRDGTKILTSEFQRTCDGYFG
ncbi:hypothetical protein AB0M97_25045 [Streptomyces sp. NPDC051207]|uniref:hypothetical protein n=1 Tax=Streptomyces sp. NPDC051207 TaxID=3154641 RepID=UPI0034269339